MMIAFTTSPVGPLPAALAQDSGGWVGLSPWLLVLGLGMLGFGLACLWIMLQRVTDLLASATRQANELSELRQQVAGWAGDRETLDLRRIEHVLVDVRDGHRRVEDALLRTVELSARPATVQGAPGPTDGGDIDALIERITNRMLAMGYERVQVVTPRADLENLPAESRCEVSIEALRGGVTHKGRVMLSAGRISDIAMQPPYAMFP